LRHLIILAEEIDWLAPGRLLDAIDLPVEMKESGSLSPFGRRTQIKHMALDDSAVGQTTIFDNAPVAVLLAIFKTF